MSKTAEEKAERFRRVATRRMNAVIQALEKLEKCADKRFYDYNQEQVDRIVFYLTDYVGYIQRLFSSNTGWTRFSLSNDKGLYWISADNGNTWTKQILSMEDVNQHVQAGYVIQKTEPENSPPHAKVTVVYDYENYDMTVFSSSPATDVECIDTSSADPSDSDYEEHFDAIHDQIDKLYDEVAAGSLFIV